MYYNIETEKKKMYTYVKYFLPWRKNPLLNPSGIFNNIQKSLRA